jgi:hypothetical protein
MCRRSGNSNCSPHESRRRSHPREQSALHPGDPCRSPSKVTGAAQRSARAVNVASATIVIALDALRESPGAWTRIEMPYRMSCVLLHACLRNGCDRSQQVSTVYSAPPMQKGQDVQSGIPSADPMLALTAPRSPTILRALFIKNGQPASRRSLHVCADKYSCTTPTTHPIARVETNEVKP